MSKVHIPGILIDPQEFRSLNIRNWGLPTGGHVGRMWKTEVKWRGDGEYINGYTVSRMEPHENPNKFWIKTYFPIPFRGAPRRSRSYDDKVPLMGVCNETRYRQERRATILGFRDVLDKEKLE